MLQDFAIKNRRKGGAYIETYTNNQIINNPNLVPIVNNFNRNEYENNKQPNKSNAVCSKNSNFFDEQNLTELNLNITVNENEKK